MSFDANQLVEWVGQFFLPFIRVAGFFATVPIFGNQLVPIRVRVLLAFSLSVVLFSVLPSIPAIELFSFRTVVLVFEQLLIGVALGFFVQVFFHIFVLAGQMVAMQMGLGFASMVDPTNGVSVAVVSQFYVILVTMLFLAFNGHLVAIEIMVKGFDYLPIGDTLADQNFFWLIAKAGGWLFSSATLLALPAITAILIVNFAFGVMTRAAPQLNIFSLGFPFTLLFGVFIIWIALSGFLPQYQQLSEVVFQRLDGLLIR